MSFKEYFGQQDSLFPKLLSGFGGGIAQKGSICGALIASIMGIGMKLGRTDPKDRETLMKLYEKVRQFWDQFEKEFGSRDCHTLTGIRHDNPEEYNQWVAAGGKKKCADIVEKTAQMFFELVERV